MCMARPSTSPRASNRSRKPAGIAVSQQVVDQVRRRVDLGFVSLGQPELKNIEASVTVYRVVMPWGERQPTLGERLRRTVPVRVRHAALILGLVGAVAIVTGGAIRYINSHAVVADAATTTFAPPAHSLAVLPFANMSGDATQEYFSDGLSEELLNALARINELHVTARTSSFSFKGKDADIATIARKLNVGAVLQGSVRRGQGKVRITAQLIDAKSGYQVWSESYDRDLADILALQTSIAEAVTSALQVKLFGKVADEVELGGTRNPHALDAYLKGVQLDVSASDGASFRALVAAFDEAIAADPGYAGAYAARTRPLMLLPAFVGEDATARSDFVARGRASAQRAITLAPEFGRGHLALARVLSEGDLDFPHAKNEYDRALALSPGDSVTQRSFALYAASLGHAASALVAAKKATELDPINPRSHAVLGIVLLAARQYEAVIESAHRAVALDPRVILAHYHAGAAYIALGKPREAVAECDAEPIGFWRNTCLAIAYRQIKEMSKAQDALKRLKVTGDANAYQIAEVHAQWGEADEALRWLNVAMRLKDGGLLGLKTDPMLDPLRGDARFAAIEKALNFP